MEKVLPLFSATVLELGPLISSSALQPGFTSSASLVRRLQTCTELYHWLS